MAESGVGAGVFGSFIYLGLLLLVACIFSFFSQILPPCSLHVVLVCFVSGSSDCQLRGKANPSFSIPHTLPIPFLLFSPTLGFKARFRLVCQSLTSVIR